MKEHPILMQGWGVRAILDSRKTQTRRVIKPQAWSYANDVLGQQQIYARSGPEDFGDPTPIRCPYGQPGDLLWIRETWAILWTEYEPDLGETIEDVPHIIEYRADTESAYPGDWQTEEARGNDYAPKWCPSIHMPKKYARIWRRVTDIRVERVQAISEADAQAEGIRRLQDFGDNTNFASWSDGTMSWNFPTAREAFADLWDSINAKPKLSKRNPWTRIPEDCYVSYPWEDIQETRQHRGKPWYVIGNPFCWAITSETADR